MALHGSRGTLSGIGGDTGAGTGTGTGIGIGTGPGTEIVVGIGKEDRSGHGKDGIGATGTGGEVGAVTTIAMRRRGGTERITREAGAGIATGGTEGKGV